MVRDLNFTLSLMKLLDFVKLRKHQLTSFKSFNSIKRQLKVTSRGSGRVTVLAYDKLMDTGLVKRIFCHFMECVLFLFDKTLFNLDNDIIF